MTSFAYIPLFFFSLFVSYFLTLYLSKKMKRVGITGKDINKKDRPEVAEMGGIGFVGAFVGGVLLALALYTFGITALNINILFVVAALLSILSVSYMGIVDDLISLPQWAKAFLPLLAAVPLVAMSAAGSTSMTIPFIGEIDFGLFYIFVLIPIGLAVASNLTNMLAGFNGLEAGMGIVIFSVMSLIALTHGNDDMAVLFVPMLGALIGFFFNNKFPAKIFPGDVGNLAIGATLAAGVIIGNLESAGAILMIPYVIDFFIKAWNGFPSTKWWGEIKNGKLYPVEGKVRGFAQLVMKIAGGISEKNLVLFFILLEGFFALVVIALYL
ncbi:MAG: hypothetical protein QXL47_01890 [Candidatus Anstonellales archaeon]